MPNAVWAPLTAFTTTLLAVWWLTHSRLGRRALDEPNARSLHQTPVPRTGGIGIHLGAVLAWAMLRPDLPWTLWLTLAALFTVSLADDVRGVPVAARLTVHLLACGLLAMVLLYEPLGAAWMFVAAVGVAWMANLYNFMDGSDGLAGGMAAFGFAFYGVAAWLAGDEAFALLNLSIGAAAAAFLVFNFYPARIFMGDAGAVPLGFMAGAFGVLGCLERDWPWWFPALVFSPFIVDATVTLARRAARGERVWEAHRDHYYQRLVRMGWGHRRTAWAEYALMAVCGLAALAGLGLAPAGQALVLTGAGFVYVVLIAAIELAWKRAAEDARR